MVDIAQYIRIFETNPSDDFVKKRQNAVKDISNKFTKNNTVDNLLSVANGIAAASEVGGALPEDLAKEIFTSIKKVSPSFISDGHELELTTCALLGAITAIENATSRGPLTSADYLAVGIWSGVSWQLGSHNENFEKLRMDLLNLSRRYVLTGATAARARSAPPKIIELAQGNENLGQVVESLKGAIGTLVANAVVDREEIDFLWWSVNGWSDVLGMRYADTVNPYVAAIALGIDAAKRLRRMPTDTHKELVLRRVRHEAGGNLMEIGESLGEDRLKLGAPFKGRALVTNNSRIFPLLNYLVTGSVGSDGPSNLSTAEIALRALLEAAAFDVIMRREV